MRGIDGSRKGQIRGKDKKISLTLAATVNITVNPFLLPLLLKTPDNKNNMSIPMLI